LLLRQTNGDDENIDETKSVLRNKLDRLALQIGYAGQSTNLTIRPITNSV